MASPAIGTKSKSFFVKYRCGTTWTDTSNKWQTREKGSGLQSSKALMSLATKLAKKTLGPGKAAKARKLKSEEVEKMNTVAGVVELFELSGYWIRRNAPG